jgi:WhiB family redox-sensing transcriptional regulator
MAMAELHSGALGCYRRGCREPECRAANARYQAHRRTLGPRRLVDSGPARAHADLYMVGHGVGMRHVAQRAEVSYKTVRRLAHDGGLIRQAVATRVLALPLDEVEPPALHRGLVDGAVTRARLDELAAAGWPRVRVAPALGLVHFDPAKLGVRVTAATAERVRRLHATVVAEGLIALLAPFATALAHALAPGPVPEAQPGFSAKLVLLGFDDPWRELAACRDVDKDIFFPHRGGSVAAAVEVCQGCAVRAECLEWALSRGVKHGVWGGYSERQRRRIRRARANRATIRD